MKNKKNIISKRFLLSLICAAILTGCGQTRLFVEENECMPPSVSNRSRALSGYCDIWKNKRRIRTRARIETNELKVNFALLDEFGVPLAIVGSDHERYTIKRVFPPLNKKTILKAAEGIRTYGIISLFDSTEFADSNTTKFSASRNSCATVWGASKIDSVLISHDRGDSKLYFSENRVLMKNHKDTIFAFTHSN